MTTATVAMKCRAKTMITFTLETITPELARTYLKSAGLNRHLSPKRVEFFISIIKDGHWKTTHQGAAFDSDGLLRDGQHRLAAIAQSGCTVQMWVARGLSADAMMHIDDGMPRTDADIFTLSGFPISRNELAVAKAMWSEYAEQQWGYFWDSPSGRCDRETLRAFTEFHAEAIAFSKPEMAVRGLTSAVVRAAIAIAWWTVDHARLKNFLTQLQAGLVEDNSKDSAVVRLRDWLLQTRLLSGGKLFRREVFGRSCTALLAYLEGRKLSKLYWRKDAKFLLPVCPDLKCIGPKGREPDRREDDDLDDEPLKDEPHGERWDGQE